MARNNIFELPRSVPGRLGLFLTNMVKTYLKVHTNEQGQVVSGLENSLTHDLVGCIEQDS